MGWSCLAEGSGGGEWGGSVFCSGGCGGGLGVGGFSFGECLVGGVGVVGDEAVEGEVDEGGDFFGVVGGPGDDLEAGSVEFGYVDCGVGAEEGGVVGGECGGGGSV